MVGWPDRCRYRAAAAAAPTQPGTGRGAAPSALTPPRSMKLSPDISIRTWPDCALIIATAHPISAASLYPGGLPRRRVSLPGPASVRQQDTEKQRSQGTDTGQDAENGLAHGAARAVPR